LMTPSNSLSSSERSLSGIDFFSCAVEIIRKRV
jgi:hypothetical protein